MFAKTSPLLQYNVLVHTIIIYSIIKKNKRYLHIHKFVHV